MGEIAAMQLFALDLRDDLGGFDTAVYNLQFESGAVGSIQWSGVALDIEPVPVHLVAQDAQLLG
jgi:hypothetical protein